MAHTMVIRKPLHIPIMAPALVIRFHSKERTITGQNAAPIPDQAKRTNQKMSLFSAKENQNAAIPTITVIGLQMAWLLSGAVIAEVVFAYPGMGRLAVTAIGYRDVPVIQAFVTVTAVIVVVINLGLDVAYSWLDPRIRLHD